MSAAADGAAADCVVANGAGLAGATGDIDGAAAGPQTPPPPTPLRGEPLAPREVQGAVGAALAGAMTALAIFLGDRLGLYRALADLSAGGGGSSGSAAAAATSAELAAAKGLSERFVREWLFQQASARLVECDERAERFWMTQAQQDVLANEDGPGASPHFFAGAAGGALRLADDREALVEAFRTGGARAQWWWRWWWLRWCTRTGWMRAAGWASDLAGWRWGAARAAEALGRQ